MCFNMVWYGTDNVMPAMTEEILGMIEVVGLVLALICWFLVKNPHGRLSIGFS